MKIKTTTGKEMELKEVTVNNITYVPHQELKILAREDGVMFDFPHTSVGSYASAMCVVSNAQGVRCYGTGQAPAFTQAADLAFDNAVIDLYGINTRSAVEVDIAAAADQIKGAKAEQERKAAEEAAAKEAAAKKVAEKAAAKKAAAEAAAKEAAAKKVAEEAAAEAAAKEAAAKKAAEETAAKKAAAEAAAKEAAAKKAAEEAAAKKAVEEAAAKKAAEEAAAKKAAEEAAAKKAAARKAATDKQAEETRKQDAGSTAPKTGYWYVNEEDWIGCHSLRPEDPGDTVVNYGPFKDAGERSDLKPGPKYLSQVLKYRSDFIEKLIGIQPPALQQYIPQILEYCQRHDIGLHATTSQARELLTKYGVKEL